MSDSDYSDQIGWGYYTLRLIKGMKNARINGPPADFTLVAEGKEFPVHKLVLFCHSDVLYKMSTNTAFIECQTGRAELKHVEARHLEAVVEYMYKQQYWAIPGSCDEGELGAEYVATIDFDIPVFILADQYNVVDLKRAVSRRIKSGFLHNVDNAERFALLVNKVADNEDLPAEFLEYAVQTASRSPESLYSTNPAQLLETRPEFAMSVFKALVTKRGQELKKRTWGGKKSFEAGVSLSDQEWGLGWGSIGNDDIGWGM